MFGILKAMFSEADTVDIVEFILGSLVIIGGGALSWYSLIWLQYYHNSWFMIPMGIGGCIVILGVTLAFTGREDGELGWSQKLLRRLLFGKKK